jgi:glyoxylase-like metal-dependent hydrolase (beta-lactamase superfamily II)
MGTFEVLVEGYAYPGDNGEYYASPTTTLITSNGKRVLVDPGTSSKLEKTEVDLIFLSHYHPDHFLNIRLFPEVPVYDAGIIWEGDKEVFFEGKIPGTNIEIIKTPGHSVEHASLLIDTSQGKVCVAQDVFWWEDGQQKSEKLEDLMNLVDPFATDIVALNQSRKKILELADWIIPGHGKIFKNPTR